MDIHRNLLVGLVYSFLSFAVNVLFFVTVSRHVEFQTNTYRIIKVMIIGCLMQLLSHLAGGVMTMSKNTFDHHVERFFGALIQSGWFLYQGASLTLAVDRVIIFRSKITFVYECTYLAFFFWGSNIVKDETVNSVTTSLLWIVDCGVFAQATITINRSIRKKMFKIRKKSHMVTTITKTIATRRLSRQPAR
ncbi:hypothetical protein L596_020885 [Steinernema carpocapsae]|uniref:7TM GPCR serpentine receptor class x (Srx) domain-containing protein n=1 Tax=Steinernema carpocapsae TaxID=34508 RepID=A0A4U5MV17_STECR|nr:hypothetical protein L596_020885 [Steinernema carpocapsae]